MNRISPCLRAEKPLGRVFRNEDLAEIAAGCPGAESFSQAYGRALTEAAEPLRKRLNDFHAAFSELRFLAGFLPAGELLDRILSSYGIDLELLSLPMGEQRLKRVERFLEESRPNGNALTVRAFLSRIEGITDGFTVTEASGGNTVRLMSIHASKGLEFPAVILAGTDRPFNFKDASGAVLFDRTLGFAVKWYDDEKKISGETPFRYLLRERIKREAVKEEARIFYVALTRAQYALHIVAAANAARKTRTNSRCSTPALIRIFCPLRCGRSCIPPPRWRRTGSAARSAGSWWESRARGSRSGCGKTSLFAIRIRRKPRFP